MRLDGKVTIVTGSSSGIGKVTALACAREGAKIVVHGRDEERIQAVTEQVKATGAEAISFRLEVSDSAQVRQMVDKTVETFGKIDVLVNNAGGGLGPTPLMGTTEEIWDQVAGTNLLGPFYCSRAVIPHMQKQGGGKIINITSDASDMQIQLNISDISYTSTKTALGGLTRQMALLYGRDGITVNTVSPGDILTPADLEWWNGMSEAERQMRLRRTAPLGKLGGPEYVAAAVIYLASAEADYITGMNLRVDGGQWMV